MNKKRVLALDSLLAEQISSQERLLWRSCPDPSHSSAVRARTLLAHTLPSGNMLALTPARRKTVTRLLMIIGGTLPMLLFLVSFQDPSLGDASVVFAVTVGLTEFLIGVLLLSLRFTAQREQGNIPPLLEPPPVPSFTGSEIYGLTDQRLLLLRVGKQRTVRSFWLRDLQEVMCIDAGDGWGDLLLFRATSQHVNENLVPDPFLHEDVTRLFGLEQVRRVESAIRCLLSHKPLAAAALSLQPDRATVPMASRAQQWQARMWCGPTPKDLSEVIICGTDLVQVRARATAWLLSHQPRCFCNTPLLPDPLVPPDASALYSSSEHTDLAQPMRHACTPPTNEQHDGNESTSRRAHSVSKRKRGNASSAHGQDETLSTPKSKPEIENGHNTASHHAQPSEEHHPSQWRRESGLQARSPSTISCDSRRPSHTSSLTICCPNAAQRISTTS